ncbi:glutathione S-transferase family protein [Brevundimonas sp. 2R-24]|uniref:Glutathione S-transferase family protein n=1 Tax=Peiella sedimenti TaxID=3061083 RepID=A0ABT8SMS9_9CAUL|nr:glutathione S-transferase family protein [Caulobacteraceae bacterium XZ-24]
MELIVGDRMFSTWSLRPWLVLKKTGLEFSVTEIPLYGPSSDAKLAVHSPSRRVPVLKADGETIWDSLAIVLWIAEAAPEAPVWPRDPVARALCRSVVCEMHSGFMGMRNDLGMGPQFPMVGPSDGRRTEVTEAAAADVRRIVAMWREMRGRFGAGGPYLFGEWSVADAFFTPVATRFRRHGVDLADYGDDETAVVYAQTLLAQPDFLEWEREAKPLDHSL